MSTEHQKKRRNRGVKACRKELEKAMRSLGLKTQVELAEVIADLENLDTIPKDLVNKVFREVSVAPQSIERVARALKVDASQLYQPEEELPPSNKETGTDQDGIEAISKNQPFKKRSRYLIAAFAVIFISILSVTLYLNNNTSDANEQHQSLFTLKPAPSGKYSVAIRSSNDYIHIGDKLKLALIDYFNVVPEVYPVYVRGARADYIEQSTQVDLVVTVSVEEIGRYLLVETTVASGHESVTLDIEQFTRTYFSRIEDRYIADISNKLANLAINGVNNKLAKLRFSREYLHYYLTGLSLLDQSDNLDKVKNGQSRFLLAIDEDDTLPFAYAGLCLAYLYESWSGEEKSMLVKAKKACDSAMEKGPKQEIVLAAQSFLLRRTGQLSQARALIEEQLNYNQNSGLLLLELANVYLELYRQIGNKEPLLDKAKQLMTTAIKYEPYYWRHPYLLGLIEWSSNNRQASLESMKKAYTLYSKSNVLLSNLSALSLCAGDIENAKVYVSETLERDPTSYISLEQMSVLHYFSQDFLQSIKLRKASIEQVTDTHIHEMWGPLADALYFNNEIDEATEVYEKAIEIIDRDYARGNQTLSHEVFRHYYSIRLMQISNNLIEGKHAIISDLDKLAPQHKALDSSAIARLALSYYYLGAYAKAKEIRILASQRCPIYLQLPDWQNESDHLTNIVKAP